MTGQEWVLGTHIVFHNLGKGEERKTNTYEVLAKDGNILLGEVR